MRTRASLLRYCRPLFSMSRPASAIRAATSSVGGSGCAVTHLQGYTNSIRAVPPSSGSSAHLHAAPHPPGACSAEQLPEGRARQDAHLLACGGDAPLLALAPFVDVPFAVAAEQRGASLPAGLAGAWQGEGSRGAGSCLPERAPDSIFFAS